MATETSNLTIPVDAAISAPSAGEDDPIWYKDAIIYQAHVKSFFDSNNDGIGDFPGLTQKLDYLQGLGVTCLWLLDRRGRARSHVANPQLRNRRLSGRLARL